MTLEELKECYGEEYPAAVVIDEKRMPLVKERRFSRSYYSPEHKYGTRISLFMDKSAAITITAAELQREWHQWNADERSDFCSACKWLSEQEDFLEMMRFIMEHGGPSDWSVIALSVAGKLPQGEAFDLLVRALRSVEPGEGANIGQAIASTKDVRAEKALRDQVERLWRDEGMWVDADFMNWVAYEAMTSILHLIELGARKDDFEGKVRQLVEHPCKGVRQSCKRLSKYFPELGMERVSPAS